MRMAILWPLDLEVVASLVYLRFSLITFMGKFILFIVRVFFTFVVKGYYIYGWYYIYG